MKSWIEISGERLAGNFAALQEAANAGRKNGRDGEIEVLAVVKANAYGHGIASCAAILANAGAAWLGVTDAHEGAAVRLVLSEAGIPGSAQPRILVMCGTAALPGEAELIVAHGLTPVVWSLPHLKALAGAVLKANLRCPLDVHLEVDTGMSRQGVSAGKGLDDILAALRAEPGVALGGVLTHFASTELPRAQQTDSQERAFEAAIKQVVATDIRTKWLHVGNSSYIDNDGYRPSWLGALAASAGARPMVRSGIALYGYLLPGEGGAEAVVAPHVSPVMNWKTRVIGLQSLPAGARIGYNGTYIAERAMKLALLPVGYADGLRRELSSTNAQPGGWVMIRGTRAPIIGRVSMNLISVDVSGIDGVAEGDEAVLIGEGVTAEDHARLAGTIAYEIICGVRAG